MDGQGQQQYSGWLWCLNNSQLVLRGPKCKKTGNLFLLLSNLNKLYPQFHYFSFLIAFCCCMQSARRSSVLYIRWLFELPFFLYQLEAVWLVSSDLWHQLSTLTQRTAASWIFSLIRPFSVNTSDDCIGKSHYLSSFWNSQTKLLFYWHQKFKYYIFVSLQNDKSIHKTWMVNTSLEHFSAFDCCTIRQQKEGRLHCRKLNTLSVVWVR